MKGKKLTYKELTQIILVNENKFNHALNTIGQTLYDYIEFLGDQDKFRTFLEKKYKEQTKDVLQHKQGEKQDIKEK